MNNFIEELDNSVKQQWRRIMEGEFFSLIARRKISRNLYRDLMAEIYHYTRHNARNQAIAAFRLPRRASGLQPFVFNHAREEYAHEDMVLRDLDSIGLLDPSPVDQIPLPPTRALIEYLYSVALRYGAIARLGYSFWAENAYQYINDDLVGVIRRDLGLEDRNLSFFIAHARIDVKHFVQVKNAIRQYCTTEEDRIAIKSVAETSLFLTGCILDELARKHS